MFSILYSYTECRSDECHCADCRGATKKGLSIFTLNRNGVEPRFGIDMGPDVNPLLAGPLVGPRAVPVVDSDVNGGQDPVEGAVRLS